MRNAQSLCKFIDDEDIGLRLRKRFNQLGPKHHMLLTAATINIVMLEEGRRRQNDISHLCRIRHELLMHSDKQVFTSKTFAHQTLFRRYIHRIGILDQHRSHRRTAIKCFAIARQDAPDLGLIEEADIHILHRATFNLALVHLEDAGIGMKCAAALV
ncbi:hypothetical protein D9M70_527240 [compost metagenome]